LALRQGRVDEAFRINRDLASSGVRQAEKLENTGNLGELRDLVRMAETASGRRDWKQTLKATERALKLLKRISPRASGTLTLLRRSRANGFYFRATEAASRGNVCEARRDLFKVKKLHRNHPNLAAAFKKFANFGAQQLDGAKSSLAKGFGFSAVRPYLQNAICTTKRSSPVHQEAQRLMKSAR
jgi:hypothetical protein